MCDRLDAVAGPGIFFPGGGGGSTVQGGIMYFNFQN